jgi:hypothetical protein
MEIPPGLMETRLRQFRPPAYLDTLNTSLSGSLFSSESLRSIDPFRSPSFFFIDFFPS